MEGLAQFFGSPVAERKEMVDGIFGIRTGAGDAINPPTLCCRARVLPFPCENNGEFRP